jgi:hypothetical protein
MGLFPTILSDWGKARSGSHCSTFAIMAAAEGHEWQLIVNIIDSFGLKTSE